MNESWACIGAVMKGNHVRRKINLAWNNMLTSHCIHMNESWTHIVWMSHGHILYERVMGTYRCGDEGQSCAAQDQFGVE